LVHATHSSVTQGMTIAGLRRSVSARTGDYKATAGST
jgi:hypothetical protein